MSAPVEYPHGYGYNAPSNGVDLLTVPVALLAYVVAYFGQAGVALPSSQFLSQGPSTSNAWDCEQLTVSCDGVSWGRSKDATQLSSTFGKASSVNAMRHVDFMVQLIRCTPSPDDTGQAPTPDDQQAAAEATLRDMGLLSQAMINFVAFQEFSDDAPLPPGGSAQAGAVAVIGPAGGFIGLNASMTLTAAVPEPPAPGSNY